MLLTCTTFLSFCLLIIEVPTTIIVFKINLVQSNHKKISGGGPSAIPTPSASLRTLALGRLQNTALLNFSGDNPGNALLLLYRLCPQAARTEVARLCPQAARTEVGRLATLHKSTLVIINYRECLT